MEVVGGMLANAEEPAWLEQTILGDFRAWQVIFLSFAGFFAIVVALCCCIRFRIPRTKQQIEADYKRRKITKKFSQLLEKVHDSKMDNMDLKSALDFLRLECKTDSESDHHTASLLSSIATSGHSSDEGSHNTSQRQKPNIQKQSKMANLATKAALLARIAKQRPANGQKMEC